MNAHIPRSTYSPSLLLVLRRSSQASQCWRLPSSIPGQSMISRRSYSSTLLPIARQRPTAATAEAGCSRPWVTSSRMSSSIIEVLFGKRVKKGLEREVGVSSRYLDSGTEDAILGRSLLHKNHNDEFLRCTEFDREGGVFSFPTFLRRC